MTLARRDGASPDERRQPPSAADRLLRALVVAWDLDDEDGFKRALSSARVQVGIMGVLPRTTIRRTES